MKLPAALAVLLLAVSAPATAEPAERHEDLIHSDLPLWGSESGRLWPRSFSDDDSVGCANRLRYGDWRFDETTRDETEAEDAASDPHWFSFTSRTAVHCAMHVADDYDRTALPGRSPDPSFLIDLGTSASAGGTVELWLLQRGARPGSTYLLLSRLKSGGGISEFAVLQRQCPRGRMRKGPELNTFLTRYCAINSRRDLTQLARRMAALPPLGRLSFVGAPPEEIEDAAEDSE